MNALKDKVAIVTGAGRGIGAAIAREYVAQGAKVIVNDLGGTVDGDGSDDSLIAQLAAELNEAAGELVAVADGGDIGDTATGERLVEAALEHFDRLDVVVNSAGIVRDRMIFNLPEEDWDAVIRVHLRGHFSTIKPASAYWREQRKPDGHYRIINMTSVSGIDGSPGQPNYAAAKTGIIGLTVSCAHALARYGVTANAISPGAATRIVATMPADKRLEADTRPADDDPRRSPERIAPLAVYLGSSRSDWLTGRVLSAHEYEFGLYAPPSVVRKVIGTAPWDDVDVFADAIEANFRSIADGLPPSHFADQLKN